MYGLVGDIQNKEVILMMYGRFGRFSDCKFHVRRLGSFRPSTLAFCSGGFGLFRIGVMNWKAGRVFH